MAVVYDDMYGLEDPAIVNLTTGAPGPDELGKSRDIVAAAVNTAVAAENSAGMLQYGPGAGDPGFLAALADMLGREDGRPRNVANLMLTAGATAGLSLIASTLLDRRKSVVFLEDPSYFIGIRLLRDDMGIPVVPVETDCDGIRVDLLEAAITAEMTKRGDRVTPMDKFWGMIYLIPTFHNPTGRCMSSERCRRVIELARRHGLLVVCDDVYNLLYYSGEKPPPRLQEFEIPGDGAYTSGVVLSNNSFSKILGPGLRVGWLEGPTCLLNPLVNSHFISSGGAPNHFTSVALGHALRAGDQEKTLQRLRQLYAARMRCVCDELSKHLPDGSTFVESRGGYYVWVGLPRALNMSTFIPEVREKHGVILMAGDKFSAGDEDDRFVGSEDFEHFLRICVAYYSEDKLSRAVRDLCGVAKDMLKRAA